MPEEGADGGNGDDAGAAGIEGQPPSDDDVLVTARGAGGVIELRGNRLRLTRGGFFGFLVTLLGIEGGYVERTIRVSEISAVEIDKPALLFRYIRFSYPGSPQLTGNDLHDMMAENAMLMSLVDNRKFYEIKERLEMIMDARGG
ncbi:MAG: hypothetical protein HQL33_05630 [Alphaproteobacteria bacterium]|nr:hypothetical protein [Alphaproteobacteria bacterium]MBF0129450.1 hypothetical protein [Alphaproteobacteria bacterium]